MRWDYRRAVLNKAVQYIAVPSSIRGFNDTDMIRVDSRIIPAEKLNKDHTVLVDAHSLSVACPILAERRVPGFEVSSFGNDLGRALANVIQTIVLYETIVVDSTLLYSHSAVEQALELFPVEDCQ